MIINIIMVSEAAVPQQLCTDGSGPECVRRWHRAKQDFAHSSKVSLYLHTYFIHKLGPTLSDGRYPATYLVNFDRRSRSCVF